MDSNLRRIVSEATRLCREQGHKVLLLCKGGGGGDGLLMVLPGACVSMRARCRQRWSKPFCAPDPSAGGPKHSGVCGQPPGRQWRP